MVDKDSVNPLGWCEVCDDWAYTQGKCQPKAEIEQLEHNIIRWFHYWDDKPTRARLERLKAAVDALIDGDDIQ